MSSHPYFPAVLVRTDDIEGALQEGARLVEIDLDPEAFAQGHIPGATHWDWQSQLRDPKTHEILSKEEFEALMGASGITPKTRVLLYGDHNNWFACWAYWLMRLFGHSRVQLVDGGARKWVSDRRELTTETASTIPEVYVSKGIQIGNRATLEHIFESFFDPKNTRLVDVRSSSEFVGTLVSPGLGTERACEFGGHIPTAVNIPWNLNCNEDGTFKSPRELQSLYESFGIRRNMTVITYCAVGERASLSWFVLKHLLGFEVVMNYDRSMAQWSTLSNSPIVTGEAA